MHTLFKSTDGNKLVLHKANCDYELAGICTYLDIPFFFFFCTGENANPCMLLDLLYTSNSVRER